MFEKIYIWTKLEHHSFSRRCSTSFLVKLSSLFLSEIKVSVMEVRSAVSQKDEGFRAAFKVVKLKTVILGKGENLNKQILKRRKF